MGSLAGSFSTVSCCFLCPLSQSSDVHEWPSVMVSVQSLHSLLWKRKGEEKDVRGVEVTAFWSSYSTVVSQGICAHSQCQNLSLACPALLSYLILSSQSWFLTCQNLALSYSSPHKMLLHRVTPPELIAPTSGKEVFILTQLSPVGIWLPAWHKSAPVRY